MVAAVLLMQAPYYSRSDVRYWLLADIPAAAAFVPY
jgi:hypothetical protein